MPPSLEKPRGHGRLLMTLPSLVVLSLAALLCGLPPAAAQDYPARPIRVITVTSAGGTSDIFMRVLADEMHKRLGQPIVIENRPGGAFNIGAGMRGSRARRLHGLHPSGRARSHSINFCSSRSLRSGRVRAGYAVVHHPQMLVVSKELNVETMHSLAALSKAKPGTLNYATGAVPSGVFLERMNCEAGRHRAGSVPRRWRAVTRC